MEARLHLRSRGTVELDLAGDKGEHVVILEAGRATLELSKPAQVAMIDEVEVGHRVAPRLRVAFEVDNTADTTGLLAEAGTEVVAPAPGELHITIFEESGPA